jgi:predicted DNA-binding transcriptional regulator AlpA
METDCSILRVMENLQPADLITVTEARRLLGVSHTKMSQLIKQGVFRHFPNPLDGRVKLISKQEVLAIVPKRAEAA